MIQEEGRPWSKRRGDRDPNTHQSSLRPRTRSRTCNDSPLIKFLSLLLSLSLPPARRSRVEHLKLNAK